jgi:outer membrane protein assembly factor BamB
MALRGIGVRSAAVAVLAAGTLAGCGAQHGLAPVLQTASGVAAFTLDNTALYVVGVPATGTVTAYRVQDGRQRWRVPDIPGTAGLTSTTAVLSGYPARCADDEDLTFTMLDASTGAARWRHAGTPVAASADGTRYLLREHGTPSGCTGGTDMRAPDAGDSPAGTPPAPAGSAAANPADDRLVALDTTTGAASWTRPLDPSTVVVPIAADSGSPAGMVTGSGVTTVSGLVTLAPDGRWQSLDPATGLPRATVELPAAATTAGADSPSVRLVSAGRTLVLAAPLAGAGAVVLSGHDPVTLAPQWTVQLPLPSADVVYQPCGNLLCVEGPDSTVAVDPATGTVRWRLDGLVRQAGQRIAVATQVPATDSTRLVDVATGRVTRTLAHSIVVGTAAPAARLVLSRMDGGRTTFSVLDLDTGDLREVGDATGRYDSCQADTGYLACRVTDSAAIHLWRIR